MDGHPKNASGDSNSATAETFLRLGEGAYHGHLATTDGVVAVLFSHPDCSSCRAWKKLLPVSLAGIARQLFEVDVSEATGVARYFDIFHLPTLYLYRDGHFHAELQCEASTPAIRQAAIDLLAAPGQDEP